MTQEEFAALLRRMMTAAQAADADAFAACFAPDGVYHDYIYGDHAGHAEIARMLRELFHRDARGYRWEMFDPVCSGEIGYAWSLSSFTSTVPEFLGRKVLIDGTSRFVLRDNLIAEYRESVNGCVAMSQLGVTPERMAKVARRWLAWLQNAPESAEFLSRAKGTRRVP